MVKQAHFLIVAELDPQVLQRMIGYFSQQALIPSRVTAIATDSSIAIEIIHPAVPEQGALVIAEKMRASAMVRSVDLSWDSKAAEARCD